jgi:hypothetical protein
MEEAAEEKKGRKDILKNMEERISGAYNIKDLQKNMTALRGKMRTYETKGELKGAMKSRYNTTVGLMERLKLLGQVAVAEVPKGPAKARVATARKRLNNALKFAAAETTTPKTMKLKKGLKNALRFGREEAAAAAAEEVAAVAAETPKRSKTMKRRSKKEVGAPGNLFVSPRAEAPSVPVPRGEYNREGVFHVKGHAQAEPGGELRDPRNLGYVFKEKSNRAKTLKKTRELRENEMPYLEKVHEKFLPLPELYNPFTGVKYLPEEDPQPDIQRAAEMLEQILEKAKKAALALKRREEKKGAK